MKPRIGLLAEVKEEGYTGAKNSYSAAIEAAGGIPFILPYSENEETLADYTASMDGFVFTGGADVDPKYYGEEIREACGKIFPLRDAFEARMFEKITSTKKPILAICRGMQVINVFLGGTLYQDIDTEYETSLAHRQTAPNTEPWHNILVLKENKLSALIGGKSQMTGNSFHHQAVKALAKGLTCTAKAEDGIIEAYTSDDYPYLAAYQWHPERLSGFDQDNHSLFKDFIAACKK
jgi:putative glutamine amidotransferase